MKIAKYIIFSSSFFLGASSLYAQVPSDPTVEIILENSPEIKALKSRLDAEIATTRSINNLSDPSVDFEYQWGQKGVGNKWGVGISQGFDWPSAYKARSEMANATRIAAASSHDAAVNDLQQRVTLLLVDLVYANQELQLLDSIASSLKQLGAKYQQGYEKGETTILDVKKIQIENLNITREQNSVIDRRTRIIGELQGISPNAPWDKIITKVDFPEVGIILGEEYYAKTIYEKDPQTRNYNDKRTLALSTINAEKKSSLPGFSIGYSHNFEIADHFNGVSIGVSIPLFSSRHKTKAAEAEVAAIEFEAEAYRTSIDADWKSLRQQALRLEDESTHYAQTLNSLDSGRLLKLALDGGEINLLAYLQEIAYFQRANRDYLALRHEYVTTVAKLNSYVN